MESKVNYILGLVIIFMNFCCISFSESDILKKVKISLVEASTVQDKDLTKGETYDAQNVKDGAPWTRWSSKFLDEQWLLLTLKKPEWISKITITWQDAYALDYFAEVQKSTGEWVQVFVTQSGDGKDDVIEFNPIYAQRVKLTFHKRATDWGFSIWEIEILGDKQGA